MTELKIAEHFKMMDPESTTSLANPHVHSSMNYLHGNSPSPPFFSPCACPCICLCCHLCASSSPCLCVSYQRNPCGRWCFKEIQTLMSGAFSFYYSIQENYSSIQVVHFEQTPPDMCIYEESRSTHHTCCHALISPVPCPSCGPYVCVPSPYTCLCTCLRRKQWEDRGKTVSHLSRVTHIDWIND